MNCLCKNNDVVKGGTLTANAHLQVIFPFVKRRQGIIEYSSICEKNIPVFLPMVHRIMTYDVI